MGTVIFPDADLKIFLDADPDERARRRAEELRERTEPTHADAGAGAGDTARNERDEAEVKRQLDEVKHDMAERDRRDRTREVAPLTAASDAVVVDSTHMAIDAVVASVVKVALLRRYPK